MFYVRLYDIFVFDKSILISYVSWGYAGDLPGSIVSFEFWNFLISSPVSVSHGTYSDLDCLLPRPPCLVALAIAATDFRFLC